MTWSGWRWIVLIAFCAMGIVVLGWPRTEKHWLQAPGRIVPAAVVLPPDRRVLRDERERRLLGAAIRGLLRRVDSLEADSAGRRLFDSLVRARPGLLDSAKIAERYFSER